jgi:putative FmdB family regulatory protein
MYEFRCKDDKTLLETKLSFHDEARPECPVCGKEMNKVISATPVRFKGSGFYSTGG